MSKKTSYKTNSWWNHRMVNGMKPDRNIDTWEDKEQDKILKQLESKEKYVKPTGGNKKKRRRMIT